MTQDTISSRFDHPKDITVNSGRVPYVVSPAYGLAPGWALPGGAITTSARYAKTIAEGIDTFTSAFTRSKK